MKFRIAFNFMTAVGQIYHYFLSDFTRARTQGIDSISQKYRLFLGIGDYKSYDISAVPQVNHKFMHKFYG